MKRLYLLWCLLAFCQTVFAQSKVDVEKTAPSIIIGQHYMNATSNTNRVQFNLGHLFQGTAKTDDYAFRFGNLTDTSPPN